MKRRTFGLLASTSLAALRCGGARAQVAKNAALLTTTLTPVGAERAGNADGSIPAWTGGCTTVPEGWQPGSFMPDPFKDDQAIVTIDASNMAQYADRLSDGVKAMMTKYGFSIKVYPTHRSAAMPQWVYDNIAQNLTTAQLNPAGGRLGFQNAYGGIPFPIPDTDVPLDAGAQIVWNHNARWQSSARREEDWSFAITGGNVILDTRNVVQTKYPYYLKTGSLATYNGWLSKQNWVADAPPTQIGNLVDWWQPSVPINTPELAWETLPGQGRVRKSPEAAFDAPADFTDGIANVDELYGFSGSLEEYDWKYLGKQEMYVPYNNNTLFGLDPYKNVQLPHYFNPDVVRWELHRVWVVEATLHAGRRNVLARRRLYVEEDTWCVSVIDAWDANNNLFTLNLTYNYLRPDLPGLINVQNTVHNMQTGDYSSLQGPFNEIAEPSVVFYDDLADSVFDPQNLAISSQY